MTFPAPEFGSLGMLRLDRYFVDCHGSLLSPCPILYQFRKRLMLFVIAFPLYPKHVICQP